MQIKKEKKKHNLYHISLSLCVTHVAGAAGALKVLVVTNIAIFFFLHRSYTKQLNMEDLQGICGGGCTRMHIHCIRTCAFLSFERLFLLQH